MNKSFDRFNYHKTLILELLQHCNAQLPFSHSNASETDRDFLNKLEELSEHKGANDEFVFLGQRLIDRIVANYPHITPVVNRDLFWFFGGSCLHYMADEEIHNYQQLEELLYDSEQKGEKADFNQLKAIAFHLH